MNKKLLALLATALVSSGAFAQQSNVTVYGVIDTAIRYTSNNNGTASQTVMTEGAFQGNRLGFKGVEDLGGGTSAIFQLENGFHAENGTIDQQGQLFGRQAYVGLKNVDLGQITFGRQYGTAFNFLGNYDPLGVGNMNENEWESFVTGIRFDNTVRYANNFGPVSVALQYTFGGQDGNSSNGVTTGFNLDYQGNGFGVGVMGQQSTMDPTTTTTAKMTVYGIGGNYTISPVTLYANYLDAKRDAGFFKAASLSGGPLANTSMIGNAGNTLQRSDKIITVGGLYHATTAIDLTLGYMSDKTSNENSLGASGKLSTIYAVADYNLSKRTDVYFAIDKSTVSGAEIDGVNTNTVLGFAGASLGGQTTRNGIALGLRTHF